jgi:hypothetical protein
LAVQSAQDAVAAWAPVHANNAADASARWRIEIGFMLELPRGG